MSFPSGICSPDFCSMCTPGCTCSSCVKAFLSGIAGLARCALRTSEKEYSAVSLEDPILGPLARVAVLDCPEDAIEFEKAVGERRKAASHPLRTEGAHLVLYSDDDDSQEGTSPNGHSSPGEHTSPDERSSVSAGRIWDWYCRVDTLRGAWAKMRTSYPSLPMTCPIGEDVLKYITTMHKCLVLSLEKRKRPSAAGEDEAFQPEPITHTDAECPGITHIGAGHPGVAPAGFQHPSIIPLGGYPPARRPRPSTDRVIGCAVASGAVIGIAIVSIFISVASNLITRAI